VDVHRGHPTSLAVEFVHWHLQKAPLNTWTPVSVYSSVSIVSTQLDTHHRM
jgi:hypothetical protein